MSQGREKVCRFCLNLFDGGYEVLKDVTRNVMEGLLLKMDLSVSKEPVACNGCMKIMLSAFSFKSACILVEEIAVSLAVDKNSSELDIIDVYLWQNVSKGMVVNKGFKVCRFCMQCRKKSNFTCLYDIKEVAVEDVLLKYLPEVDPHIIKDPLVCTPCIKSLEQYYNFATACQRTEENIMKYRKAQGKDFTTQINLRDILKSVFEDVQEFIGTCGATDIEKENNFCKEKWDLYPVVNGNQSVEKNDVIEEDIGQDCNPAVNDSDDDSGHDCNESPAETNRQMLTHASSSKYKCSRENVKGQISKQKDNTSWYKCELCPYTTNNKPNFKHHTIAHKDLSEVKVPECELCDYKSRRRYNVKDHMVTHKNPSAAIMYNCETCSFKTKYKSHLNRHMLIHEKSSKMNLFMCANCPYASKFKDTLRRHMLVHQAKSEATMYKCRQCSFKTRHKKSLQNHELLHERKGTYKCYKCPFRTGLKWYLKDHDTKVHRKAKHGKVGKKLHKH